MRQHKKRQASPSVFCCVVLFRGERSVVGCSPPPRPPRELSLHSQPQGPGPAAQVRPGGGACSQSLRLSALGMGRIPSRCAFLGPSPAGGTPPGAPVAVSTPPAPSPGPTSSVSTTHSLHFSCPDHSVEVFILEHRKPAEKINKSKHRLLEKIDETDTSLG